MKIAIFYFTGSGNTGLVAKRWKECATELGHKVDIYPMEKIDPEDFNFEQYDYLGFGHPVHAFNAPTLCNKFVKRIPKQHKKIKAFGFMVSGENLRLNNSSNNRLRRILKRRNIIVESDYHYVMPYNMIFRHTELRAYKMFEAMNKIVPIDVKELFELGINHKLKRLYILGWFVFILKIEQLFAPINGMFFKVDNEKCVKCMSCVKLCPVDNIKYEDDKFKFGTKCVMCTRCSFNCPTDAFSIGLLNNWRVNKKYKFKMPEMVEEDKHPRYCKNSYIKYFNEIDARLKKYKK